MGSPDLPQMPEVFRLYRTLTIALEILLFFKTILTWSTFKLLLGIIFFILFGKLI